MPKISVVVPTYNAQKHIVETLQLLLRQDEDFEILVLDDASTDSTLDLARGLNDPRIRFFPLERNQGRTENANRAFDLCRGDYIARIDHDDIAEPGRLRKQAAFLDANPDITVVGSQIRHFGEDDTVSRFPLDDGKIKAWFLVGAAYLANPSAMFRRDFIQRYRIRYDPNLYIVDDLGFWFDCALRGARFANLPEVLTAYRIHPGMASRSLRLGQLYDAKKRLLGRMLPAYFPRVTGEDVRNLCTLLDFPLKPEPDVATLVAIFRSAGVALSEIDGRLGVDLNELTERLGGLVAAKWNASHEVHPRNDQDKDQCCAAMAEAMNANAQRAA